MGKVSDLTEMSTLAESDDLYVVDDVLSRRITALNLGNTLPVKATGSTTARALAARFSDVINVKDHGASSANSAAANTVAFQAAIDDVSTRGIIMVPGNADENYAVTTSSLNIGSKTIFWQGDALINGSTVWTLPGVCMSLGPERIIVNMDNTGPDDYATWEFRRNANYSGAGSGGVSSNVRVFTDVGASAGSVGTLESEWGINARIDSASANVNAVALSGQARRNAAGAVWSGHFNTIDNTNPTMTKTSRAIEANIQADGTDTQNLRVVVEALAKNLADSYNGGADNVAEGIRIRADSSDFKRGLVIDENAGTYTETAIKIYADSPKLIDANAKTSLGAVEIGSNITSGVVASYRGFGQNSNGNSVVIAKVDSNLITNTAGAEDGRLSLYTAVGGTLVEQVRITQSTINPFNIVVAGSLQNVTVGASDSGGTGFRLLRVPN